MTNSIRPLKLETIKLDAIEEWKVLNNIAIPNTKIGYILNALSNKYDSNDYGVEISDEYVDVALPNGTYTFIVKNGLVEKMSPYIELFDGDKRIAERSEIYVTWNGRLDIKL